MKIVLISFYFSKTCSEMGFFYILFFCPEVYLAMLCVIMWCLNCFTVLFLLRYGRVMSAHFCYISIYIRNKPYAHCLRMAPADYMHKFVDCWHGYQLWWAGLTLLNLTLCILMEIKCFLLLLIKVSMLKKCTFKGLCKFYFLAY